MALQVPLTDFARGLHYGMDMFASLRQWFTSARPATAEVTQHQDARRSVLMVGDDGLPPALYKLLFREHDAEFICRYAKNADSAIRYIHGQKLDVVVMNWTLSGHYSGHDLLLSIRRLARTEDLPVLVLAEGKDQGEARSHGATRCLPQSCGMSLLMEQLRIYSRQQEGRRGG